MYQSLGGEAGAKAGENVCIPSVFPVRLCWETEETLVF